METRTGQYFELSVEPLTQVNKKLLRYVSLIYSMLTIISLRKSGLKSRNLQNCAVFKVLINCTWALVQKTGNHKDDKFSFTKDFTIGMMLKIQASYVQKGPLYILFISLNSHKMHRSSRCMQCSPQENS